MNKVCGVFVLASLVCFASTRAMGHDFWLMPSTFQPRAGERFDVSLLVGVQFEGESTKRYDLKIQKFGLFGPGGERPIIGRNGADPAGVTLATSPGLWTLCYVSNDSFVELEPEKFDAYLKEEGLQHVLEERAKLGESLLPGREAYSRSVKALIRVSADASRAIGTSSAEPRIEADERAERKEIPGLAEALRPLGLPQELVPQSDPTTISAPQPLNLLLLKEGKPQAGALVRAYLKGQKGEVRSARTDGEGKVGFPIDRPGTWMFATVTIRRAGEHASEAQWRSVWSTLTFEVPTGNWPSLNTPDTPR